MMKRLMLNEYRNNSNFRNYVDRYAVKHRLILDEALEHELVRQAYLYYTDV